MLRNCRTCSACVKSITEFPRGFKIIMQAPGPGSIDKRAMQAQYQTKRRICVDQLPPPRTAGFSPMWTCCSRRHDRADTSRKIHLPNPMKRVPLYTAQNQGRHQVIIICGSRFEVGLPSSQRLIRGLSLKTKSTERNKNESS